jgi:hypothetical protein
MNNTMFDDIANKLKGGFTHEQIKQITGVEEKYIKQIEDYIKENTNEKLS